MKEIELKPCPSEKDTENWLLEREAMALREELHQQKEKYALLLERHIAMMERTVKLDEQREAD